MKRLFFLFFLCVLAFPTLSAVPMTASATEPTRKIIVFKEGILKSSEQGKLIEFLGGENIKDLKLLNAKVARISRPAAGL